MTPSPALSSATVRRILIVRPRFMGDICLTLPVLDAVRAACPEAQVAYLVERESAPLLDGDPRVDTLLTIDRKPSASATWRLVRRLRAFGPDVALDLFCNPRTAVWTFASGAPVRVGYPYKGWRSALYTHYTRPRTLSAIEFHLASVATLGWAAPYRVPRLHVGATARSDAERRLFELGVPSHAPLLGLHPGARWPTRIWAPDRFAELATRWLDAHEGGRALITGGPGEEARVGEVMATLPRDRAHAAVDWPLATVVALQARCAAFVCGDTGPMHTAVAAGTPTLGLFSRQRPSIFFPYPESEGHRLHYARVECSPCSRDQCEDLRCLHRLTVDGAWRLLSTMPSRAETPSAPRRAAKAL